MLRENDDLSANPHGIRTAWRGETEMLPGMIAGAAQTAGGEGTAAGGSAWLEHWRNFTT